MKPYVLIKGTIDNIGEFEDKVSAALEEGYEFSGDLITKEFMSGGSSSLLLIQPMIAEEEVMFDSDDFEDMEDYEEEEAS